jgi:hypothetical protein
MGSTCVQAEYFFLIIFAAIFLVLGGLVLVFLGYKRKQSDSVWHISVDELHFNEPPEIIGQGAFGVVVLGQYRGTKVAVKRVLPPSVRSLKKGSALMSGIDGSVQASESQTNKKLGRGKKELRKSVSFDEDYKAGDIEAPPDAKTGSTGSTSLSKSNKALEEFLQLDSTWEETLQRDWKYDNALKILETATLSSHASCSYGVASGYQSLTKGSLLIERLPLWMRFDEQAKLRREFVNEMRLLSRLR